MSRSMDNLEQLSDNELRLRLLQYGFPNLPITHTTRGIIIKKLRNQINNEKAKLRRESRNITRYSSDEDSSDNNANRKQRKAKSSASNILGGYSEQRSISSDEMMQMPPPPPVSRLNKRQTNKLSSLSPTLLLPQSSSSVMRAAATSSSSSSIMARNTLNNFHMPSSSTGTAATISSSSSILKQKSPKDSIYIPPPIIVNETDEDSDYGVQKPKNANQSTLLSSSSKRYDMNYSPLISTNRYSVGSHYSMNATTGSDLAQSSISSTSLNNGCNNSANDSPYLSDFTRRLLNLRGETIRDSSIYNRSNESRSRLSPQSSYYFHNQSSSSSITPTDPTEIVHQQPEPRSDNTITPSAAFSNLLNRLDEQYGVKQTFIPCILLSILVVFFAMVVLMYVTISPDLVNTINEKTTLYTLCEPNNQSLNSALIETPQDTCIQKDSINDALELLKIIVPELQKRAENNRCVDNDSPYTLSAKEAIILVQQRNHNLRTTIFNLHNLEYLIEMNPQWKILHTDSNGKQINFDELLKLRYTQSNHFALSTPKLPLTCLLYNKLQRFFNFIYIIGITLITIGVVYLIYRIIKNYQQWKREAVTNFIDEIINTLMRQAAINPERSTIIVNHLRDKLIPLHKRNKLEWAWDEAIKFLEQNESRIQFDYGTRNGEDVKLMKWIDTSSLYNNNLNGNNLEQQRYGNNRSSLSSSSALLMNHSKKWHSPAFDKTNKIANPPTQCLKIRQMFDKFEANNPNLKQIIQDAILEKVGPNCKIYDIQLDKQSCCVYVRCASVKDAGIVHNEINGWWFDKRLVSIKFLRLERYLNRFPKSLSGPQCLYPSNTQNLSMSQCSNNLNSVNDIEEDDIDDVDDDDDN